MRVYSTFEVREATAYADGGGQALHLHRIIPDRRTAPRCFVREVDQGQPIAHLFDNDRERLIATARSLGVKVIHIDRDGERGQHIDLCSGPLRKACKLLDADQGERLKEVLATFKKGDADGDDGTEAG